MVFNYYSFNGYTRVDASPCGSKKRTLEPLEPDYQDCEPLGKSSGNWTLGLYKSSEGLNCWSISPAQIETFWIRLV